MRVTRDYHHALGRLRQELAIFDESEVDSPEAKRLVEYGVRPFLETISEDKPRARSTDPETSHAAAASIDEEKLRASQIAVLHAFRYRENQHGGRATMIDEELVAWYEKWRTSFNWPPQEPSGIRTRRKELASGGFLEKAEMRPNAAGKNCRAWRWTRKVPE